MSCVKPDVTAFDMEIAAIRKGSRLSGAAIANLAQKYGLSLKDVMLGLLDRDIWPERFCRNAGILSAREMRLLLEMRVFMAGCGGLGGAVADMLARTGIGMFRLCDPDVFEETNLNRHLFCTEKTLGRPKASVVGAGLLGIASHLTVEALEIAATEDNLPALLRDMDVAIDCLDSVKAKKMLENAAQKAGIAYLHGAVLAREGLVWLDKPAGRRLERLYPQADNGAEPIPVLAGTVCGTAALMCSMLVRNAADGEEHSPVLHLDLSVPEIEGFDG